MSALEWALSAASRGWAVIPLWRAVNGVCGCALGKDCGKNAGKHPDTRPGMAPRGSTDATTNLDVIHRWFEHNPDHNYGIVCGSRSNGLMIQDVDVTDIAQRFLEAGAATVKTGKGCHIYIQTSNPGQTAIPFTLDGHKSLGELRGQGMYVVGPGSIHATGVEYELIRGPSGDWPPIATVVDPYRHAKELFETIGQTKVEPISPSDKKIEWVGRVQAQDLPFSLDSSDDLVCIQLVEGTYATKDRSKYIFHTASEIVRAAQRKGHVLTLEQLAGIIKKVDMSMPSPKFYGRRNSDAEYAREASAALHGAISTATAEAPPPTYPYVWGLTVGHGEMLRYMGGTQELLVSNFTPRLHEEVVIEGGTDPTRRYTLRCEKAGHADIYVELTPRDLSSDQNLRKTLYTQLPADYNVRPDGWKVLFEAAKYMAQGQYAKRVQYAEAGWTAEGGYVLPGADGAMTSDGMDSNLVFNQADTDRLPERLYLYGQGVTMPIAAEDEGLAQKSFAALLDCAKSDMLLPVLTHVMGGPLAQWLTPRYVLHVQGRSGLLKTAFCCSVLSLFGRFVDENWQSLVPETWLSTANALSGVLYVMKDATVIIDDYKESSIKSHRDVTALIQAYADGTTRGRMNVDQSLRASLLPRGLILSTGEDVWEDQEATRARTLLVEFKEGCVDPAKLRTVQHYAENGSLALAGGAYLHWLANKGAIAIHSDLDKYRHIIEDEVGSRMPPDTHKRMVLNLVNMLASAALVRDFVAERMPDLLTTYSTIVQQAIPLLMEAAAQSSLEAQQLSTFDRFRDWLLDSLRAKRIYLKAHKRLGGTKVLGGGGTKMVGYYDASYVLTTETMIMSVYREDLRRQGESPAFGWSQLRGEIKRLGGETRRNDRSENGVWSPCWIPRRALGLDNDEALADIEDDTVPSFLQNMV